MHDVNSGATGNSCFVRWPIGVASVTVFMIAVALRIPSCYESFWVDELHSAWSVWGDLTDVAPRADMGHQSPFYFLGLWFWKQTFGDSELVLRISSVLLVAAGCVVLIVGIVRSGGSLIAGITAGLILAIEDNSIFFGTELRPFAAVILCSSIACVCFMRLASLHSRQADRWTWVGLIVAILFAGLCQPTSLGVLWLLPVMLVGVWSYLDRRSLLRISLTDGMLLISTMAVGFTLWSMTLNDTWANRQTWASFASATSLWQIWPVWDWVWLWLVPMAVLMATPWFHRSGDRCRILIPTLLLSLIAALATLAYWWVSWVEWLPLWHRRYLIAVLPMFALIAGGSVAAIAQSERIKPLAPVVAICLIFGLAYRQNMHRSLVRYPVALISRGEDWRGAIDWVRCQAKRNDWVYIESGLIESRQWLRSVDREIDNPARASGPSSIQRSYLCYAAFGPYALEQSVEPIDSDLEIPLNVLNDDTKQIFIVIRRPADRIPINPTKWGWVYGNRFIGEIKSFGNVTVISMPTLDQ